MFLFRSPAIYRDLSQQTALYPMANTLAKVGVVGSNPIARSNKIKTLADLQEPLAIVVITY